MIAYGCKIGANAVVNRSFNIENSIVAGIPARLLKIDDVEKC
jgi:serine acetyltransferase